MASSLGSLVVRLGLDAAEFTTGLSRAEADAKKFNDRLQSLGRSAGAALGGVVLAAGAAGVAFAALVNDSIKAAAALDDMAEKTGATVETLSAMAEVARVGGHDFNAVGESMVKLVKAMEASRDPSSEAARAFASIGISAFDAGGKLKNTGDFTLEFARKLNQFADGAGKTALATVGINKAFADQLPYLKDLAEFGDIVATTTAKQAAEAENYEKNLKRLSFAKQELARVIGVELVPVMDDFVKAILSASRETGGLRDKAKSLSGDGSLRSWFQDLALGIAHATDFLIDWAKAFRVTIDLIPTGMSQIKELGLQFLGLAKLASGDLSGYNDIVTAYGRMVGAGREWAKQLDDLVHRESFASKVKKQFAVRLLDDRDAIEGASFATKKPDVPYKSKGAADTTSRAFLDQQLKGIDAALSAEKDSLSRRESFLQAFYQDDLVSYADYFAKRRALVSDGLDSEIAAYDAKIHKLQVFAGTAKPQDAEEQKYFNKADAKQRVDAETQIADAIAKTGKAHLDRAFKTEFTYIEEARAAKAFKRTIDELGVAVLAAHGDTVSAAAIGFELQNEKLRDQIKLLKESGDQEKVNLALRGEKYLDDLKARAIAQAALNKSTQEYSNVVDLLGVKQGRIDLLQQTGALTEIDAMNKRADLAREYIVILSRQADEVAKAAAAMGAGPDKDAALIRVQQLRLEIDKLAASTDALAKKFNDAFADPIQSAIEKLATGAGSLRDIFKQLEKDIVGNLSKIAAQDIKERLFGKDGPLSFIGKSLAGLFGDKGASAAGGGASGADAALVALGATSTATDTSLLALGVTSTATDASLVAMSAASAAGTAAITSLAAAAAAAATALATVAASSAASGIGSALGGGGGGGSGELVDFAGVGTFAKGTNYAPGGLAVVGERGPELVNLPRGAQVIPNDELMRRRNDRSPVVHQTVNFYHTGAVDRSSKAQLAVAAGRGLQRVLSRDG